MKCGGDLGGALLPLMPHPILQQLLDSTALGLSLCMTGMNGMVSVGHFDAQGENIWVQAVKVYPTAQA